jgi:hypothetical protein
MVIKSYVKIWRRGAKTGAQSNEKTRNLHSPVPARGCETSKAFRQRAATTKKISSLATQEYA